MRKVRGMRNTASRANLPLRLLAPAKINLHLRVGPRRDDGFHPLLSWMATVGLFDTLILNAAPAPEDRGSESAHRSDGVVMSCDDPSLPCDGRNLVLRAAVQFRQNVSAVACLSAGASGKTAGTPRESLLSIHLEKRIPAGGGLGGGSSDAARTLQGLEHLCRSHLCQSNRPEDSAGSALLELAARLGSDVPFFLYGPSSVCKGRGEAVRPIAAPERAKWVTLVLPPIAMPTVDVYRRFDQMNLGREQDVEQEPSWQQWVRLDSRSLLEQLVNDLETPAFDLRPDLAALRAGIEKTVNRPVRMSGSGSSLFTLFDQREESLTAAERIGTDHGVRAIAIELCPVIQDDLQ